MPQHMTLLPLVFIMSVFVFDKLRWQIRHPNHGAVPSSARSTAWGMVPIIHSVSEGDPSSNFKTTATPGFAACVRKPATTYSVVENESLALNRLFK